MTISSRIRTAMENSSWIRRMFEEGTELKAKLGPDRVFVRGHLGSKGTSSGVEVGQVVGTDWTIRKWLQLV